MIATDSRFSRIRVRSLLALMTGCAFFALSSVAALSVIFLERASEAYDYTVNHTFHRVQMLEELKFLTVAMGFAASEITLAMKESVHREKKREIEQLRRSYNDVWDAFTAVPAPNEEIIQHRATIENASKSSQKALDDFLAAHSLGHRDTSARMLLERFIDQQRMWAIAIDANVEARRLEAEQKTESIRKNMRTAVWAVAFLTAMALAASAWIWWMVRRVLQRQFGAEPDDVSRLVAKVVKGKSELRTLAFFDPLTALPNRSTFFIFISELVADVQANRLDSFALIYFDLDRFKDVNDTVGHGVGDQILEALTQRLSGLLGDAAFFARLGGDEFAVVARGAKEQEAQSTAQRIVEALREPILAGDHSFLIGCSVGVVICPAGGLSVSDLMKSADIAMYEAKRANAGVIFHHASMSKRVEQEVALHGDLMAAMKNNRGLSLSYQPQFDLRTGEIVGAEALMRWNHPEIGAISPSVFIPLAEERGMMLEVGDWVLREACAQLQAWKAGGFQFPGRLGINVSAQQMKVPNAAQRFVHLLGEFSVSPLEIELEITEGALVEKVEEVVVTMEDLRVAGFALAIDDFGTGYSSLSYLTRFQVEHLKIDMSFVRGMLDSRKNQAVIAGILGMAGPLQLTTIAEGVETEAQAKALRDLGCNFAQGFLYSRPLVAAEFCSRFLSKPA